jgi:hypothetical protein
MGATSPSAPCRERGGIHPTSPLLPRASKVGSGALPAVATDFRERLACLGASSRLGPDPQKKTLRFLSSRTLMSGAIVHRLTCRAPFTLRSKSSRQPERS